MKKFVEGVAFAEALADSLDAVSAVTVQAAVALLPVAIGLHRRYEVVAGRCRL